MKCSLKKLVIATLILCSVVACKQTDPISPSNFKLPALVGNNMVLQQNASVNIWGWARGRQKIKIQTTWDKKSYSTRADKEGNWKLQINTIEAGGPYEIVISAD